MITAAQAQKLSKRGAKDAEIVEDALELIAPKIEEAAKNGLQHLSLSTIPALSQLSGLGVHSFILDGSIDSDSSRIRERLILALRSLGYEANLYPHGSPYVPRGLADDDGNGPRTQNYTIIIRW